MVLEIAHAFERGCLGLLNYMAVEKVLDAEQTRLKEVEGGEGRGVNVGCHNYELTASKQYPDSYVRAESRSHEARIAYEGIMVTLSCLQSDKASWSSGPLPGQWMR